MLLMVVVMAWKAATASRLCSCVQWMLACSCRVCCLPARDRYTGFDGCGGNSLSDLTTLEFKNTRPRYTTQLCLNGIRLLSLGSAADSN